MDKEITTNGSYLEWYKALVDFRRYIESRYLLFKFGQKYRHKFLKTESGDIVDHHIISYLAPLDFKRIGWNGERLTPVEQVASIARYFQRHNTRFIYAAIPNKYSIYPELICSDRSLMNGITINVPQWRKYIRELLVLGVEVIDMFPVFTSHKNECALFSKDHFISSSGASLTADTIAEYLRATTGNLDSSYSIENEYQHIFAGAMSEVETARVCFIMKNGLREPFWNQNAQISKIAIFGDCNLQSYTQIGAGISANLACNLGYPVYNAGRKLIFSGRDNTFTNEDIMQLMRFDIVIYNAFASASFVRSAWVNRRSLLSTKWSSIKIPALPC